MKYKNFILEKDEHGIATLTANRPEKLNAMDSAAWEELLHFITEANHDSSIRAVIITGAGEKAFIAGADVAALKARTPAAALFSSGTLATSAIESCSKPVIAAVNGYAFGGGCEVALACDIRIVSENAVFALPETGLGIVPGAGGTQRLARMVGVSRAKEMILLGRKVKAQEAVDFGMAYRCVPADQLMSESKKAAIKIIEKGPISTYLCKKLIRASMSSDEDTGLLLENLSLAVSCGTEDKYEGVTAFLERRKPEFSGK